MPRFDDVPAAVASVLNVSVDFRSRGLVTNDGVVPDLAAFKQALVSSIKAPIVFERGESLSSERGRAKLALGHAIYTHIIVYVVCAGADARRASLRKKLLVLADDETVVEYIARRDGTDVVLAGTPALDATAQTRLFLSLAADLAATQIFDEEGPFVAEMLRRHMDDL